MNIVFLTHMARSGSTLLARELDRFDAVSVGIEESLPDGIVKGEEVFLESRADLDDYLERAWQDRKLAEWGVKGDALRMRLITNHSFPIRFPEILEELLGLYLNPHPNAYLVHKKGPYYLHVERVREQFPDARFIHIDRDPRGIYNSQKKSRRSNSGQIMAEPLTTFAFQYLAAQHAISRYQREPYFHVVCYEDFVKDPQSELLRIMEFLGLQKLQASEHGSYLERIPGGQHHLHGNLGSVILPERALSWKEELEAEELYFFQQALGKTLRSKGYPLVDVQPFSLKAKVSVWCKLMWFYIKHTMKNYCPALYRLAGGKTYGK
ncbi:MAG: sulfotransferase [Bacteroidales bacterium]|nr:sulfotransferase [Bacteroidales bacterium]